ncbi:MAG TPA: DUF2339 domain-containing protein, partial [Candidatus Thermoplasmatota archaeon]|nr:DUF2339 domain-containing protein [Candidatus Thermoplasmatota archaeon]
MAEPEPRRPAPPVSREEFEELRQRLLALEALLAGKGGESAEAPSAREGPRPVPTRPEPAASRQPPPPAEAARAPPKVPFDGTGRRVAVPVRAVTEAPEKLAEKPGAQRAFTVPRLGAVLVFLASVFFFGVAIERGWVGPVAQLLVAATAGAGIAGAGAWLTSRTGRGLLPQLLEGAGLTLLFAAAFVSYAVPYYQEATGMDALLSGLFMAFVGGGMTALGVHRETRLLVALGYGLGFTTAGLGLSLLPYLSLVYVTVLGASLAGLVAARGWNAEALAGSLTTGGFFVAFAFGSAPPPPEGPPPALVALLSLLPLAGYLYLALRPDPTRNPDEASREDPAPEAWARLLTRFEAAAQEIHPWAVLAAATIGWGVLVTVRPFFAQDLPVAAGLALLAWCLFALGFTLTAARRLAVPSVTAVLGVTALVLHLVWPPIFWGDSRNAMLVTTATYLAGAATLLVVHLRRPEAPWALHGWAAALVLTGAAAYRALLTDGHLPFPAEGTLLGSWRALVVLALLLPCVGLLVVTRAGNLPPHPSRAALLLGAAMVGAWAFAFTADAVAPVVYLAAVGAALALAALLLPHRPDAPAWRATLPRDAFFGGLGFTTVAASLALFLEGHIAFTGAGGEILGPWTAFLLFPLFAGAFSLLAAAPTHVASEGARRLAFGVGAVFLALWAFALFHHPLFATLYLVALGGGLAAASLLLGPVREDEERPALVEDAFLAALVLLGGTAVKTVTLAFQPAEQLPGPLALVDAALVAGALLALFHACRARGAPLREPVPGLEEALLGGAATVLGTIAFVYGPGPWGSVSLAALGGAGLALGFTLRDAGAYRAVGGALLVAAAARVAFVDLAEGDLLLRSLAFALLALLMAAAGVALVLRHWRARKAQEAAPLAIVID